MPGLFVSAAGRGPREKENGPRTGRSKTGGACAPPGANGRAYQPCLGSWVVPWVRAMATCMAYSVCGG